MTFNRFREISLEFLGDLEVERYKFQAAIEFYDKVINDFMFTMK